MPFRIGAVVAAGVVGVVESGVVVGAAAAAAVAVGQRGEHYVQHSTRPCSGCNQLLEPRARAKAQRL